MAELKPCPFCGSKDLIFRPGGFINVQCRGCGVAVAFCAKTEDFVKYAKGRNIEEITAFEWNMRGKKRKRWLKNT